MVHVLYMMVQWPSVTTVLLSIFIKKKKKLLHFLKKDRAAVATPFRNATQKKRVWTSLEALADTSKN